ncbi:hypothetical protein [Halorubrum salsamenti]|uniref:hypothetical protein n=1 Tax=Halorubrum salsamenti TaxID=2583990 RepID=UPI0019D59191|nr:hypothetical protein [Halorubrum salsamenti]
MSQPTDWTVFRDMLIGTTAGMISYAGMSGGIVSGFGTSFLYYIFVIVSLRILRKILDWGDNEEIDDEEEERPHQEIKYAS